MACIDQAPPELPVPNDMLPATVVLERRLRDLGLLVGVNDAENMNDSAAFDALRCETP
jgi:hypothetical protein